MEEGKADWLTVMECVPVVRCWAMECKGGVDEPVECGLHGSSGHKCPWGCTAVSVGWRFVVVAVVEGGNAASRTVATAHP